MPYLNRNILSLSSFNVSAYDDFGFQPGDISRQQREENIELFIERYFVCSERRNQSVSAELAREAVVREVSPGENFNERLEAEEELVLGGFGPELKPPSGMVEAAFRDYGQTDLGAVAIARLIDRDNQFIETGWREADGTLTEEGISAYGRGQWRPFRVASHGDGQDVVTPSGLLLLPDIFEDEYCSTGDLSNPLAVIHHEIKAHVLPLKEGEGLVHGREMALICMCLETELLHELGLPARRLEWGLDDGPLNQTLHEPSELFFHGLVRVDDGAQLIEIDPSTGREIGFARVLSDKLA